MAQLLKAAGHGDIDRVCSMLDQINFQNKKGETALHVAIMEGQIEMVKFLLNNGADVNKQDKRSKFTPAMLCLAQQPIGYLEMFEVLVKNRCDFALKDSTGQSVLHLATQYQIEEAVEILLRAQCPVDLTDDTRMTALLVAAGKGNLNLIELLVNIGHANVNSTDKANNNALHWACISESDEVVSILRFLKKKGTQMVQNNVGNTPLHSEAMHCLPSAKWPSAAGSFLIQEYAGCENAKNASNLTPLELFSKQNLEESQDPIDASVENPLPKKDTPVQVPVNNANTARAAALNRSKKGKKGSTATKDKSSTLTTSVIVIAIIAVVIALAISNMA